jgi:hypothetical protein
MQIMGGSATILFGKEWATVIMLRFGKDRGKQHSKGKKDRGSQKGAYEGTVVYSKEDAVMKPP